MSTLATGVQIRTPCSAMLSSTPSKSSRRSTRVGRQRTSGGFGSRQSSRDETSWRLSDKSAPARKWVQVIRPPSPTARFFIPIWVTVDDLTAEERIKYCPEPEKNPESADTEMALDAKQKDEARDTSDTIMATPDPTGEFSQPASAQESSETSKQTDAFPDPSSLIPLTVSRLPSPGMRPVALDSQKPISTDARPHDPVAATIAEPGIVPPSRPVSEPSAILMNGPAAPLIGDSVASPVAVVASSSAAPVPPNMEVPNAAFVHSGSTETPFHAPNASVASKVEPKMEEALPEPMAVETSEAAHDRNPEPETQRPRLE